MDILKRDDHALVGRYIDASDTGHVKILLNAHKGALKTKDDTYASRAMTFLSWRTAHTRDFAEACPYRRVFAPVNGLKCKKASENEVPHTLFTSF
jgi:hypothetical protein